LYFPYQFEVKQLKALEDKVKTVAEIVSYSVGSAVYFDDLDATYEQITPLLKNEEIQYLVIQNNNNSIFFEFNLPLALQKDYKNFKNNYLSKDNGTFRIASDIIVNDETIGKLYLGYSLKNLKIEVAEIQDNIRIVSLIIFLLGAASVFYIGFIITKPLINMVDVVEKIRGGNLSIRAAIKSKDEIGYLAKSFNSMVDRIEETNEEMEIINKDLENRVEERTKELAESEERFRGLYENATIGIYRTTPDGKVLLANPALVKMLGYNSLDEFKNTYDIGAGYLDPNGRIKFVQEVEKTGVLIGMEQEWKKLNGAIINIRESARAMKDENGNVLYYDGTVEDITAKKIIENELIQAKEKAEASVRMKTEFLAQMSHEIRTPINSILSYTQLLKDEIIEKVPEDLRFSFDMINNGGRRLIRTVDLILNMSELQTGTYEVIIEKFNLVEILEQLVGEFKTAAKSKGLDLMLINRLDKGDSIMQADIYTVTQIFANLIDNAVKYTNKGSIEVVAFKTNEGNVGVDVQDTGIGISKKFQEALFDPFTQEEQGYTRKFDGNGLGMALVKEYCKLNNANISVKSEKEVGSTFTILFNNNTVFASEEQTREDEPSLTI